MKLKDGWTLHQLAGQYLAVATGAAAQCNGMIRNNETADFLFRQLQGGTTRQALVDSLLAEYAVDKPQAEEDTDALLAQLRADGLLEEP